jgi:hypothetical protein
MILLSQTPCAFVGVLDAVRFFGCCETDAAAGCEPSRRDTAWALPIALKCVVQQIACMVYVQSVLGPRDVCIPKIAQDGGRWD